MRTVVSGGREIDRCLTCGATWFDEGEIRELLDGRLEAPAGEGEKPPAGEEVPSLPAMHRQAAGLSCPRCGKALSALSYQATGVPIFHCRECRGFLAPRASARALAAKAAFQREHRAEYEALGTSLAEETRRRLATQQAADRIRGGGRIPLPVVLPLSDSGTPSETIPWATWGVLGLLAAVQILSTAGVSAASSLARSALPPGTGFTDVPRSGLVLSLFLQGGIVPLVLNGVFLFVLGDNVEDRMGRIPYVLFLLFCGVAANAVHVLWGPAGEPAALGAAGAVAGIVGAYLVFFPDVAVRMYRMGEIVTVPSYIFACFWLATVFLTGQGVLERLFFSAPLSLQGTVGGFGAGALASIAWRSLEGDAPPRPTSGDDSARERSAG